MPAIQEAQFNLHELAEIDNGKINVLTMQHLARLAQDCIDRPGDKTARKLLIEIEVKPVQQQDGSCELVKTAIECRSKVPTYRTRQYEMRPTKAGFRFNRDFPDDLNQLPLIDED